MTLVSGNMTSGNMTFGRLDRNSSYLLIYFILLYTLLYYTLIDCEIIKILWLSLFMIVNVPNKHSNKMADKSRAIVFTFVDVWCCDERAKKPIFGRVPSMELLFRTFSLAKIRLLMGTAAEQKAIN